MHIMNQSTRDYVPRKLGRYTCVVGDKEMEMQPKVDDKLAYNYFTMNNEAVF